jgi:glycosyltransferase involved in cell wall biosynthesis
MSTIKLSICCITFNHELFIAQALDSFLMQKTDFDFEIVVGEDASKDNTRKILLEYQKNHPEKIKLLLHDQNQGMIPNFYRTISECSGEYIAICEGDDYWTNENKLQTQVNWMDEHPDYSFHFHRVKRMRNGLFVDFFPDMEEDTSIDFMRLLDDWNIAIGSMVFRKALMPGVQLMLSAKVGDQSLCYGLVAKGPIFYSSTCLGDYRYHAGGITNDTSIVWNIERIKMFQKLIEFEGEPFRLPIEDKIISLMMPKINYLKKMPLSLKKIILYIGFYKELFVDFNFLGKHLRRNIYSQLFKFKV